MMSRLTYQLTIRQSSAQTCDVELLGPQGQRDAATLPYPVAVIDRYQDWRHHYHQFYQGSLRARVAEAGSLNRSPGDGCRQLLQAEAALQQALDQWLRHPALHGLRLALIRGDDRPPAAPGLDLLLTCPDPVLSRLPWETWDLKDDVPGPFRLARVPDQIGAAHPSPRRPRRRVRVLAILGDDTGLDFEADRQALCQLAPVAEVEFVGWQPGHKLDSATLSQHIFTALTDVRGWDILFFAGHSNETVLTGGELGIAPDTSLSFKQLAPYLRQALARGLQFALFNSCSGLAMAQSLLRLGCSQVAIMREPVRNDVAQQFLVAFVQGLGQHHDVHDALLMACTILQTQQALIYPSAHLLPSLFRHPDVPLFQLAPGWQQWRRQWRPRRREAIALTLGITLSLLLPVQGWLLAQRQWVQACYRHVTDQMPRGQPPVLLVEIDDQSIAQQGLEQLNPLDRRYLAQLVTRLSMLKARVVGIDYVLDYAQAAGDVALRSALEQAVKQHPLKLVFATVPAPNGHDWLQAPSTLVDPAWARHGDAEILALPYLRLLPQRQTEVTPLPFAYQLLLARDQARNRFSFFHPSLLTQLSYRLGADVAAPIGGCLHPASAGVSTASGLAAPGAFCPSLRIRAPICPGRDHCSGRIQCCGD